MPADQLNRGEQLPDRQRTGGDVLAVVPGVVPAARDVEQSVLGPARVERPGVGSLPRGYGRVPGVRSDAGMTGRSAVARGPDLLDGATRPLQIEEPQRVPSQPHVQPTVDHELVTGRLTGRDLERPGGGEVGEVQEVNVQAGGGFGSHRPGPALPRVGSSAALIEHIKVDQLRETLTPTWPTSVRRAGSRVGSP